MEIKIFNSSDLTEWNRLISEFDYSTIFHTSGWLNAIEKGGGGRLILMAGVEEGQPVAMCPMFLKKKIGMNMLFSPPPQMATPYLGPIFKGYSLLKQSNRESMYLDFIELLDKYITEELKPDYELIFTPPGLMDIRPFQWKGYSTSPLYDYIHDLSLGTEYLWNNLGKNIRGEIKQAKDSGVVVREGGKKEFEELIADIRKRYGEQGLTVTTSDSFLMEIFNALYPNYIRVLIGEYQGERVGGIVDLIHQDTVLSWIGGVRSSFEGVSPNSLVQWESLRIASETGSKRYIEMGANTRHLCAYKRQFNPGVYPYFQARRVSSIVMPLIEFVYKQGLKPLNLSIKLSGGKSDN
jgi:hypothetical protein